MTKRPITDKEFQQLAIEHGRKKGWLPSSASPACSIAPDRHATLKPVIEYAEQIGFPQTKDTLHSERDSFMALVDALDLRLKWLERQGQ